VRRLTLSAACVRCGGCCCCALRHIHATRSPHHRTRLTHCREHQPYAAQQEAAHPEHRNPQLGFLSLIAFPNYFARSFGEFGSRRWRQWGARLTALRIPVRCCFLEALPLLRGIPGAV
jgi:hypothetical protein